MKRNAFFDGIKGLAIFLVALGHCLQGINPDYEKDPVFLLIIMFHMPLFMVVSGYFFYPSVSKMTFSQYANKKFKRLYLPSLVWGVFQAILIGTGKLFKGKTLDIYYFSELVVTGMWFLTVLFILCMIGALINTITKKTYLSTLGSSIFSHIYITL